MPKSLLPLESERKEAASLERDDSSMSRSAWAADPEGTGLRAFVTPTTSGLRAALRDEGPSIHALGPLLHGKKPSQGSSSRRR